MLPCIRVHIRIPLSHLTPDFVDLLFLTAKHHTRDTLK